MIEVEYINPCDLSSAMRSGDRRCIGMYEGIAVVSNDDISGGGATGRAGVCKNCARSMLVTEKITPGTSEIESDIDKQ